MGEAAEDVLDGTVCQGCGEWMDDILNGGEAPGFPRSCERCEPKAPPPRRRLPPANGDDARRRAGRARHEGD